MKEKLTGALGKTKDFFKNMSKKLRIILIVGLVVIVAAVAAVVIYNSTRPYAMLFTDLNTEDMANVVSYLEANGVKNYQIRNNDTILVPEPEEARLRAGLLQNRIYPTSGFSYDTYLNNVGMLSSAEDRQRLDLYQLQDRLGAVISLLNGVQSAVVTITPQEDNRWVLDSNNLTKASAQAVVTMKRGANMTRDMADSIRGLLVTGVKGLNVENVQVVDQDGKTWSMNSIVDASDASALMVSLQTQVNEEIRNKIISLMSTLYGAQNVDVAVHSTVDVSKTYEESITYNYPDDTAWNSLGGHGLIGEYAWDIALLQGENAPAGGVVGTTTNADLHEYVINRGLNGEGVEEMGDSGKITYDNDKTTTQRENFGGVVTDVTVAVAVNSLAFPDGVLPDSEAMVSLVARAAGIGSEMENEKVRIAFRPFYTEPVEPSVPSQQRLPDWAMFALITGLALFVLLLILIILLRSRAKRRRADILAALEEEEAAAAAAAFVPIMAEGPEDEGAQIMDIQAERTMELRQDVRKFVEENPEIAAQMIKNWLRGGDDNG